MKKILISLIILIILLAGGYFALKQYYPDGLEKLKALLLGSSTNNTMTYVNMNENSNVAFVATQDDGVGVMITTKNINGTEYADKLFIETADKRKAEIKLDNYGRPSTFKLEGYTLKFSGYTETTVDIEIIHPDGSKESKKSLPLEKKTSSLISTARAAGTELSPETGASRQDHGDGKYFLDIVGTCWNGIICGAGILTNIVPNPISTFAAAVGCTQLLARVVPAEVVTSECDEGDSVFDCAAKILDIAIKTYPMFQGQVSSKDGEHLIPDVEIIVTHKNGKKINLASEKYGVFGKGDNQVPLVYNGTYFITATREEFAPRNFIMVISDDKIKIVDENNNNIYDQPNQGDQFRDFEFTMGIEEFQVWTINLNPPPAEIHQGPVCNEKFIIHTYQGVTFIVDNGKIVKVQQDASCEKYCPIWPIDGSISLDRKIDAWLSRFPSDKIELKGKLEEETGVGEWKWDSMSCYGTWTAKRNYQDVTISKNQ